MRGIDCLSFCLADLRKYGIPVPGECFADLCRGLPADAPLHPLYIGLVYFMQLRNAPDLCPANRIKRPHGQVQI